MNARKRERIIIEIKLADEYLRAADTLYRSGLFTPSVSSSFYAVFHASIAASITGGEGAGTDVLVNEFKVLLDKFNKRLDPAVGRLKEASVSIGRQGSVEYPENEALLNMYQAKEFIAKVKDFVKRFVRFE